MGNTMVEVAVRWANDEIDLAEAMESVAVLKDGSDDPDNSIESVREQVGLLLTPEQFDRFKEAYDKV